MDVKYMYKILKKKKKFSLFFNILVFDFQRIYMLDFHNHSFVKHVMLFLLVYMNQFQ
jgi:hypothetical protein